MLSELIGSLSKEEVRHFKLLSKAVLKKGERLDVELFDHLRKGKKETKVSSFEERYYNGNINAFYRLKNRLSRQVSKTLLHLHHADDLHHEVLECIKLGRVFYKREEYGLCEFYLKKAEKKAIKLDDYDYLNIIYREMISLSFEIESLNPEQLIEKQKRTYEKQIKVKELNNVVAIVKHQLRRTQNLKNDSITIDTLLRDTIDRYANDKNLLESYQFQYSIYQIISQFLLSQQNWSELFSFVNERYNSFEENGYFDKNNHESKLQMLTYLVNAAFKKGDLNVSLAKTEELYDEMLKYEKVYYHKYLFFYYQALVLSYSETNPIKAIRVLNEIKDDKEFISNPYYVQFVLLNLSLLYLAQHQPNKALESIQSLLSSASYKTFDDGLKIHLQMLQMVILYECEQYDSLLIQLKKHINENDKRKEFRWMKVLFRITRRDEYELSESLAMEVQSLIKLLNLNKGELSELYDFNRWINEIIAKN